MAAGMRKAMVSSRVSRPPGSHDERRPQIGRKADRKSEGSNQTQERIVTDCCVCMCMRPGLAGERSSRLDEQRAGSKMSTGCDSQRVSVAPRYIVVRRVSGRVAPWVEALRPSGVKAFHEGGGACVLGWCGLWTKRRSQDGDKWRRPECAVEATRLGDNEQRSTAW